MGADKMNVKNRISHLLYDNMLYQDRTSMYRMWGLYLYQGFADGAFFNQKALPDELGHYNDFFTVKEYDHEGKELAQERKKKTINMTYIVSTLIRTLVMNEGFQVTIDNDNNLGDDDNPKYEKATFFDNVLKHNNFYSREGDLLEYTIAMGDNLKVIWFDPEEDDPEKKPKISFVKGNKFEIVRHHNGQPKSVLVTTVKEVMEKTKLGRKQKVYYHLLELHEIKKENYQIKREIYKGESRYQLKHQLSFANTAHEFGLREGKETELFEDTTPLFVYTRNPIANNKDLDSPRGLGMTINAADIMDAINTAFDRDTMETEDAAFKIILPQDWLNTTYDLDTGKNIRFFNAKTRMYAGVNAEDGAMTKPEVFAPTMRTEQYEQKIENGQKRFAKEIKISPQTFSYDPQTQTTATQVKLEHGETHSLRNEIIKELRNKWGDMLYIIYKYGKRLGVIDFELEREDIDIHFPDGVTIDDETKFKQDMEAVKGEVISKDTFRRRHYQMNSDESNAESEKIDNQTAGFEPDEFLGDET